MHFSLTISLFASFHHFDLSLLIILSNYVVVRLLVLSYFILCNDMNYIVIEIKANMIFKMMENSLKNARNFAVY